MSNLHDYEADPRPFADCLRAWREAHDWTWQQAADELRKPITSVQHMAKGRGTADEQTLRRLMTLIDLVQGMQGPISSTDDPGPPAPHPRR